MGPARSPAVDAAAGRRHQPARQARTNPHRTTGSYSNGGRRDSAGGPASGQPIDIFPGVTHFADAITALPKELVRHLTLLKEVDAKSSTPEQHLQDLVQACLDSPAPRPNTAADAASASSPGAATSAQNGPGAVVLHNNARPAADEAHRAAVYDQANTPRRQLFLSTAAQIKDMLMSLDEKNHVICTANEALQRQLTRVEDIWPHLEAEFSEEAKWGSTTHWAYPENRTGKPVANERSRRDGPSAAALQAAEEAAARSELRKQAVQAKRSQRGQAQDGDNEGGKRAPKGRKTAESSAAVGLGITAGAANGAANPPSKRRKVEKPVNGGSVPSERAMSSVFGNVGKGKATTSPRTTPAPEGQKKRKALPSGPTQAKKRFVQPRVDYCPHFYEHMLTTVPSSRNGAAASSTTSSPVLGAFPEAKTSARNSPVPAPTSTPKLGSSRSKPNNTSQPPEAAANANGASNASTPATGTGRPSSAAPGTPPGTAPNTPDLAAPGNGARQGPEPKPAAQRAESETQGVVATPAAREAKEDKSASTATGKKEKETPKPEESEKKAAESARAAPTPIATSTPAAPASTPAAQTPVTVTTKSGRASKPSTPALATFHEASAARSRSSRAGEKRSHHKKSASQSVAPAGNGAPRVGEEDEEEDGDIDADELTYCYCNGVSYGAMVACDADECEREWFHLECVGLKVAPKQNGKFLLPTVILTSHVLGAG